MDSNVPVNGPEVAFSLKYGSDHVDFRIPRRNLNLVIQPPAPKPLDDVQAALDNCVDSPIGTPPLRELIRPGDRVAVVCSDVTRLSARCDLLVPFVLRKLTSWGVSESNITVIIATGTHRGQTPEERKRIVGEEVLKRFAVVDHDSRDDRGCTFLGTTSRGTPVYVNRIVAEAEKVILTGGIDFHALAGYGGGRKAICPGVCSYETITTNHSYSLGKLEGELLSNKCGRGKLDGNPVAEDMDEVAAMVSPTFILNTIVDQDARVVELVGGDWRLAFREGCERLRRLYAVPVPSKSDVVVVGCGGYPKDISVYQSTKALSAAVEVANEGGSVVLVSESRDGLGDRLFEEWLSYPSVSEIAKALANGFQLPGHHALRLLDMTTRHPTYVVSAISEEIARKMNAIKVTSVDEAIQRVRAKKGNDLSVSVMPFGKMIMPVVTGNTR